MDHITHTLGAGETINAIIRKHNRQVMPKEILDTLKIEFRKLNPDCTPRVGTLVEIPKYDFPDEKPEVITIPIPTEPAVVVKSDPEPVVPKPEVKEVVFTPRTDDDRAMMRRQERRRRAKLEARGIFVEEGPIKHPPAPKKPAAPAKKTAPPKRRGTPVNPQPKVKTVEPKVKAVDTPTLEPVKTQGLTDKQRLRRDVAVRNRRRRR